MLERWLKRAVIFLGIIASLLIAFLFFLHTNAGRSLVRQQLESFLQKKWGTAVSIGNIDYRLPNWILLERLMILDRNKDTLLSGGRLYVEIRMLKLLSNVVSISGLQLEDISLHCYREDSRKEFNFQFILDSFAPAENKKKRQENGTPLQLSVNELSLKRIKLTFHDQAQFSLSAFIDELSIEANALKPEKNNFRLTDLTLRNSQVSFVDSSEISNVSPSQVNDNSRTGSLLLALEQLKLHHVSFDYRVPHKKTGYTFQVDSLAIQQASLNLSRKHASAKSIWLGNSNVRLANWRQKNNTTSKQKPTSTARKREWSFAVQSIQLHNNFFSYHNNAQPHRDGLDFQHIDLKDISLQTSGNRFDASGFFTDLNTLSLDYNKRLYVKDISSKVHFSTSLLLVQNLKAAINQSQVTTAGDIAWPLKRGVQETGHRFAIKSSSISYGDLLLIKPTLKKQVPISLLPTDKIMLSGLFSGTSQRLLGQRINLAVSNRQLLFNGDAELLLRKGAPQITATVQRLDVHKNILSKDLLQQLEKRRLFLPAEIALTGKVQLDAQTCITKLKLNSDFGDLVIDGKVRNIKSPQHISYTLTLDAHDFSLGKLLGLDSQLGKINGRVFVDGKGLLKNNLEAVARLEMQSAMINGYLFSGIDLQAQIKRSGFNISSRINDENLQSNLELNGIIGDDSQVQGNISIQKADLLKLGLVNDSLVYAGNITVNGSYSSPDHLDAFVQLDSNHISFGAKQIQTGSLSVRCNGEIDTVNLSIQAPFAEVQLSGNYPVKNLPNEMMFAWRKLYVFNDSTNKETSIHDSTHHNTWLDASIKQDELISKFLPQLELRQPLSIQGRFHKSRKDSSQSLQLTAPAVRYLNYEAEDLKVEAYTAGSETEFSLQALQLVKGNKLVGAVHISGRMQKDMLTMKASASDSLGKALYAAQVEVKKENGETAIRLLDDPTVNYNKWKVSPGNRIRISKEGYIVDDLLLENRGQTIRINSKEQNAVAPIDVGIENFEISHPFAALSPGDSLIPKGNLNADISIQQPIHKIPVVIGNIRAANLSFANIPLGNLHFRSANVGDSIDVQGELSGANQIGFTGRMHLLDGGMALQAHLQKVNTDIIKSLTKDVFNRMSAKITGDFRVNGPAGALQYSGAVHIDSTAFSLKALNTVYRINKQKLVIDHPALRFEQFVLTDSAGHPLTVNGTVTLFDPLKKSIDLSVETVDFVALQTTRQPGALLYGTGIVDAALNVKGTIDEPLLEGNAGLKGKSKVHVVSSPKRKYTKSRKDGIVFVKMDTLASVDSNLAEVLFDSVASAAPLKGLKYNLSLKVDKEAEFSVLVNSATGDELAVKGEARLNVGTGKSDKMGIEGIYNLQSGYYKMNNLLLRGRFMLVKGSSISFNGDPSLAEADVTTEYTVEASPKGLVSYKDENSSEYAQRVPFAVVLTMKGPIAKPVLSFDIQLRPGKAVLKSSIKSDVEHALNRLRSDVTEMNKQVFSLLLTKQFASTAAENTLESSNLNANNALKEGVSSFLTEAMDQVADQLIKNVDVDVSMKTYKTDNDPVSKTDLGVAMSKDLFEDRLIIRIEENFAVGNNSSYPVKSGSQYVPDITSTYKLSKDGRFQLKAYQKNEYDAVVQGYFTEVGVNFTIELSYDKFKELVQRRKNQSGDDK